MTAEHHRSTVPYNGPTSIGNTSGVSGGYSVGSPSSYSLGYPQGGVYGSFNGSYVRADAQNYGRCASVNCVCVCVCVLLRMYLCSGAPGVHVYAGRPDFPPYFLFAYLVASLPGL